MRVLIMGAPTSKGYQSHGLNTSVFGGGWVENLIDSISGEKDIVIFSMFYADSCPEVCMKELDGVYYIALPARIRTLDRCNDEMIADLRKAVELSRPDVVHIIGTEREHDLRLAEIVGFEKTVLSITGMVSVIEQHYYGGVDVRKFWPPSLGDIYRRGGPIKERKRFERLGIYEKELISRAKYVMGRTTWDYACVKHLNPNIQYIYCNEVLNPAFSKAVWAFENCDRYRIFLSQASYPLKGLQKMLEAFPLILTRYPEAEIYIAGPNILKSDTIMDRIKRTTYSNYIADLLREKNIDLSKIHFTGPLSPTEMVEQYLKCNVFVLPSAIENSPNSLGEAMSLGVPCVASCVGGVQDMLRDRVDGFIYPFDESYMLAHYVCRIFADDRIANEFSRNARENVKKRFDSDQVRRTTAETYVYIYNQLKE